MPGRLYSEPSSSYRYGYNGHERIDEFSRIGICYDFGNYGYDIRVIYHSRQLKKCI